MSQASPALSDLASVASGAGPGGAGPGGAAPGAAPDRAAPGAAPDRAARRAVRGLIEALGLLTILPVPKLLRADGDFSLSGSAVAWFPVVGAGIGAIAGGLRLALQPLFGAGPGTALSMAGLVIISGALHQDGLADTADGLGVRGDRARRLAVMRDSAIGAFGVLALIGWALLLFAVLEPLTPDHAFRILIAACTAARLAALIHSRMTAPARTDGLGVSLRVPLPALAIAVLFTAAVAVVTLSPARGAVGVGTCLAVSLLSVAGARAAIGGSTGDTLGATVAVTEVCVALAVMAMWH
jgi:adenosylcobinamide-GDP ribazoletransferase